MFLVYICLLPNGITSLYARQSASATTRLRTGLKGNLAAALRGMSPSHSPCGTSALPALSFTANALSAALGMSTPGLSGSTLSEKQAGGIQPKAHGSTVVAHPSEMPDRPKPVAGAMAVLHARPARWWGMLPHPNGQRNRGMSWLRKRDC